MDKGVDACERAMQRNAQLPEALAARAFLFYAHGQYAQAIEYARVALERKHDCEGAYFALGMSLFMSDRLEEAAALAERAIEVSGDDYNIYPAFNNTFKKLGNREREMRVRSRHVRILEWHLEWAPDNVRARVLLACCLASLGETDRAIVEVETAIAAAPSDASTLINAACAYGTLGRATEALSLLKRAVANGYWHFDLIAREPDFVILHGDPEFQALITPKNS
jgi:non-specific serine/threonine protein kinase